MTTTLVRRTGALTLIAVAATALSGCAGVIGATMTYNDTEKAKITDIVLSGGSGDVTITTAAVDTTTIKRVIRRTTNPGESYHLTGSTLNIDTSCGMDCSVNYEIQAPPGVNVRGALHSGDVHLDGIGTTDIQVTSGDMWINNASGPVKVKATSGDISVTGAKCMVSAVATSGDIRAIDPAGAVDVKATSGDVQVHLAIPHSVTAHVTSGDVDVTVPRGSYNVLTRTNHSGDTSLHGMVSDPASKNVLDIQTSSGDVNVSTTA